MKTVDDMQKLAYEYKSKETGEVFSLPYRIYYPDGYSENPDKKYPLFFFLHGHGECGTENEKQIRVLGKRNLLLDNLVSENRCIILAPQCPCEPINHEWVAVNHVWSTCSRDMLPEKPTVALGAAAELFFSCVKANRVDENRIYIGGISMGGYGAWEMLTRYPDTFAAAIILCGAGFPSYAESLKNVSIRAFHGTVDGTVLPSGLRDMEAALKSVGGRIESTYLEGLGHAIWEESYSTPGLTDWLYSQAKK